MSFHFLFVVVVVVQNFFYFPLFILFSSLNFQCTALSAGYALLLFSFLNNTLPVSSKPRALNTQIQKFEYIERLLLRTNTSTTISKATGGSDGNDNNDYGNGGGNVVNDMSMWHAVYKALSDQKFINTCMHTNTGAHAHTHTHFDV